MTNFCNDASRSASDPRRVPRRDADRVRPRFRRGLQIILAVQEHRQRRDYKQLQGAQDQTGHAEDRFGDAGRQDDQVQAHGSVVGARRRATETTIFPGVHFLWDRNTTWTVRWTFGDERGHQHIPEDGVQRSRSRIRAESGHGRDGGELRPGISHPLSTRGILSRD